jgi:hypothetical protein
MSGTPKNGHLRVRVNSRDHERLVDLAAKRDGGDDTVSDVVRDAIDSYLASDGEPDNLTLSAISDAAREHLLALAKELNRTPLQVLEDCIEGIFDLAETKKAPLIVMELDLRRRHYSQKHASPRTKVRV